MTDLRATIANILDEIVSLRHELHRRPEIRFEVRWTSDRIAQFLDEAGVTYWRGWAGGAGIETMATLALRRLETQAE